MTYKNLTIKIRDDNIAIVTLNSPEKYNTLRSELMKEM